jgi:hypothetical protein
MENAATARTQGLSAIGIGINVATATQVPSAKRYS